VLLQYAGENKIAVMPLFVAITPSMRVEFDEARGGSGSGGPRREFRNAAGITYPPYAIA